MLPNKAIPVQTGALSVHVPITLDPSPLQDLVLAPSRKNPSLQEWVATVPKANQPYMAALYDISPLTIELREVQLIATHMREGFSTVFFVLGRFIFHVSFKWGKLKISMTVLNVWCSD